ncbi:MAG: PTS sugar transporter subunit IIA [Collinsella sp.]|nr:PTS sugar transporter subunit IIA [Collinsella sp.]
MSLPSLREVVLRQRTLANAVCSDWDDVVSRAASVLFNDPMQAGEWGTDVRNIQKEYGQMSILPHGVCMPHGYPRSSYSLSMTLISLADPVVLHLPTGCEEIRLIMAVAAPNNEIQARMLDELFCLLEEGAELVDRLTEAQNSDELYERFIEQYERRFP